MPHADAESKLKNEIANIEAELQKEMPTDIHTELVGVWPNKTGCLLLDLQVTCSLLKANFHLPPLPFVFGSTAMTWNEVTSAIAYSTLFTCGSFQTITNTLDLSSPSVLLTKLSKETRDLITKRNEKLWYYFGLLLLKEHLTTVDCLHQILKYSELSKVFEFAVTEMQLLDQSKVNDKDNDKKTALDWAIESQNKEAAALLFRQFAFATDAQRQIMHNMDIDVSTILQERERELLERQRKTEMQSADNLRDVQEKIDLQESNQQKMRKALGANFGNQQILLEQFVDLQQANIYLHQENQVLNQALTDRDRQVDQVQQKNQVLESRVCQMETQLNQVMKMLEAINPTERANAAAKTSSTFFQQP